ncbi:glycosyltransferase family 4 protein [Acidovorax sp. sif1233]|uniref:glycosyltransferase family 4 protein n=1 Tax=unclassified Acidovorax TaxID=2684926 RepID=UPI001C439429|nr:MULTISPECIES: glycosyltransferase family 1 protein [unclassified Acidovorax]MBV7429208.1 glycosyltransferase family 4 protein [Acidovorax sp. sif0732]MBV7451034.1 glycosyltransferase family 4 protein [Acidovorax sp. sif0715]MBV7453995.1 glycosyltransferase family 4 protein [Acidovorax sp. sif1233]
MNVAFGVSVLARSIQQGGVDGIGTYTRELMAAMPQAARLQPYVFDAPTSVWRGATPAMPFGSFAWQALAATLVGVDFGHARRALGKGTDLVHATDHLVPRLRGIPVVATIFDAIPLSNPEWVRYRFKSLKNELWRRTAFWAQHVITISEYSRQEIAIHFRLPEERITAIPLGVGAQWFVPLDAALHEAVRSRHALPDHYFVSVGTLQPRKNIDRLLSAHASLPEHLQREYPLLIVGKPGWGCDDVVARFTGGGLKHVRWLRHLPDAELQVVIKRATALVFPSLHEGFGLPVLEAFAAGVPVVASNTTSIPEVAGDAALLIDPLRTDEIADAMRRIAEQPELAARLVARGRDRVQAFSWQACAEKTLRVYESMA